MCRRRKIKAFRAGLWGRWLHHRQTSPGRIKVLLAWLVSLRSTSRQNRGRVVMGKLQGKAALVTGSGRNIGRATVLHLAREGAHFIVNARSTHAKADAVVREGHPPSARRLSNCAVKAKK